jgi:cytochrome d ubiquinol oxidase subunit II
MFGAMSFVYSTVLSALYLPIIFMVIALIFRGVAFEFRFKAQNISTQNNPLEKAG